MPTALLPYKDSLFQTLPSSEGPSWLHSYQKEALERLRHIGLPSRKWELWKYVDVSGLLQASFLTGPQIQWDIRDSIASSDKPYWIGPYSQIVEKVPNIKPYFHISPTEMDPFYLINASHFEKGIALYVPENTVIESLEIDVILPDVSEPIASYPRIFGYLGKNSAVTLSLRFIASSGTFFKNAVTEFRLDDGAKLRVIQAHFHGQEGYHMESTRVWMGTRCDCAIYGFIQDSRLSRHELQVEMNGENSTFDLKGASLLTGDTKLYFHSHIRHNQPACVSRQLYKNILADSSISEFNGLVYVHPQAQKTDSMQSNHNLLISDNARAYSRPQLNIFADDVKCTHGATIGQLDETSLFYLMSRGLSKEKARSILMYSFLEEVIETIPTASIRDYFESEIQTKLPSVLERYHAEMRQAL